MVDGMFDTEHRSVGEGGGRRWEERAWEPGKETFVSSSVGINIRGPWHPKTRPRGGRNQARRQAPMELSPRLTVSQSHSLTVSQSPRRLKRSTYN